MIDKPGYYKMDGIEVIDVIAAYTADLRGEIAFDCGNAIKYLLRWGSKGGPSDLLKAKWYIDRMVEYYGGAEKIRECAEAEEKEKKEEGDKLSFTATVDYDEAVKELFERVFG